MIAIALIVIVVLVVEREQLRLPGQISDATIVATLGSRARPYPSALRAAAAQAHLSPNDQSAALDAARRYLDYGRATGDARFAGAALGLLDPWLGPKAEPAALNLAASARQYAHDFQGALALLNRATKINPRDAQALLSRANINIVQGRFRDAEADCLNLARARRADLALLCDTTAKALSKEAPDAYARLDRLVASNAIDPALKGYAHSLLAEMARFLERTQEAGPQFEAARAADPSDLRTLMIFADFELASNQPAEALTVLSSAPPTDSVMVRQAIAAKMLGDASEVARLSALLRQRFEEQAALGEAAHAREAARYWLDVAGKPDAALAAAKANWVNQRELEDALLFIDAAQAAGQPSAARPVTDWAASEGVLAPMYLSALDRLESPKP